MPEPQLRRDGNLRLAVIASPGWPADPQALVAEVRGLLQGSGAEPYGAATVLFSLPPEDLPPERWECTVGTPITGMARPGARLRVEDFRQLVALTLAHDGPVRDLPATWRRLADHAKGQGHRLRPYWRVSLRNRLLADGNLLPVAEASVFIDRG